MMKLYIIALFAVVALGSPQGYPSFGGQLWENPTQQICAQSGYLGTLYKATSSNVVRRPRIVATVTAVIFPLEMVLSVVEM
ncbi:hypothetical protein VCV18_007401 [Metarhizium anisopliae]